MPQPILAANGSAQPNGHAAVAAAPQDAAAIADSVLREIQSRSPAASKPLTAVEEADRQAFIDTCG